MERVPGGGALDFIVDRLEVGIVCVDADMRITLWNRFMASHSGRAAEEVIGRNLFETFPSLPARWLEKKIRNVFLLRNYSFTSWEQRPYLFAFDHDRPVTGGIAQMQQSCTFLPVKDAAGEVRQVCITLSDQTDTAIYHGRLKSVIAELEHEREEQKRLIVELEGAQSQLLQSEKLASIGQLAAGVAHEINNPLGFVKSNFGTLDRYVDNILKLLDAYRDSADALDAQRRGAIGELEREIDVAYLREDVRDLVRESREGLDRVTRIVQDLKDFSRVDSGHAWERYDLHRCLDSTLNVASNEIKYKAEVRKEYGTLPEIECLPSQINQVLLNLLVNAAQAIAERGTITVSTGAEDGWVWIAIADTGVGIDPEILNRIFDPFFTTKPVGKGTGLGLSVSYSIVSRHGGRIEADSTPGAGSTFRLWLPVDQGKDVECSEQLQARAA